MWKKTYTDLSFTQIFCSDLQKKLVHGSHQISKMAGLKHKSKYIQIYNIDFDLFSNYCVFSEINAKNHDFHGFFMTSTIKIEFAPILTILFVIFVCKKSCFHCARIRAQVFPLLVDCSNQLFLNFSFRLKIPKHNLKEEK